LNKEKDASAVKTKISTYRLRWDGRRYYLPAELRERISSDWILTRGDKSLHLFEGKEWSRVLEMVWQAKRSDAATVASRYLIAPSMQKDLSKKYLYIPKHLPEKGEIQGKDVILTLCGSQGRIRAVDGDIQDDTEAEFKNMNVRGESQ